jgi:hypothetical protein
MLKSCRSAEIGCFIMIVSLLTVCMVNAQSLEHEKEILDMIGDFSERICPAVPMEGSSGSVELSGTASSLLKNLSQRDA